MNVNFSAAILYKHLFTFIEKHFRKAKNKTKQKKLA